jgi:cobalt-zinc-cadmium efflux system membrane fusion protein
MMLYSCGSSKSQAPEAPADTINENQVTLTKAQMSNSNIETTSMEQKDIAINLKLIGKIDVPPQNLVSVSVPMGGYLRQTNLLPGMHVSKGQVLAVIEDQQYIQLQQDYMLAKSNYSYAEKEYRRQYELNQSQASSDKVTQQAQAEMNNQKIMMNSIAEKLRLININPSNVSPKNITKSVNIYSTINGFVNKVNVNIGKYVTSSDVLFELINPSDIHLNLKVYEKDVSRIAIGQKVIAYNNARPEIKHRCEIILISKDIGPDGTSEVHCHFDDYDKTLFPGMYMNAEVEVTSNLSNTLPEESIVTYEGKNFIFIDKSNSSDSVKSYEIMEVSIGKQENGFIEILNSEVFANKQIVFKGAYTLLMKMKNKEE